MQEKTCSCRLKRKILSQRNNKGGIWILDSPDELGNDKRKKTERRFAIVRITTIVVMAVL